MATHHHLTRDPRAGTDSVTPHDVEDLRVLHRGLREGSPLREVVADLLLALCASATIPGDLVVDISRTCNRKA